MKLKRADLRNFRRLEDISIDFEEGETVFVGPNNSGKTSATAAFKIFLRGQEFKVYDFSVAKINILNSLDSARKWHEDDLPSVEMDLWFSVDPSTEYGLVGVLLPNVGGTFSEVGIRLKYKAKDPEQLRQDYISMFPAGENQKPLSHFLSLPANLKTHFEVSYFALEQKDDDLVLHPRKPSEVKQLLKSLVRGDFVDAQRNMDDQEIGSGKRLSSAFNSFYVNNLEQLEANEEANRVIDKNNDNLNKHYASTFQDLMAVVQGLGVPSINDREMKIVSSVRPEIALQGSTDLLYVDNMLGHELPEAYNGLGFKNLVYIAIQISHFHLQWMRTNEKRPRCQIIFIEEPEAHLHAQVQQTFVSNIWAIVRKAAKEAGELHMVPQLCITTHSSHMLEEVEFEKVRYFRRCLLAGESAEPNSVLNATDVRSLRTFRPQKNSAAGEAENETDTIQFLKRYLKLTHCDLFFADAAVLVEGTVEKLLLPTMIDKTATGLNKCFLSILEVGGAYASRFASLFEFLGIPYLVITDLDSVAPSEKGNGKTCRADTENATTSNSTLKFFFNIARVNVISALTCDQQKLADGNCFVAFQKPTTVEGHDPPLKMHGRTLEETFVYTNMQLFRDGKIEIGKKIPSGLEFEKEYDAVYKRIKSDSFKKTEFALDVASSDSEWITPEYIAEGLAWLEDRMGVGVAK